MQLVIYPLPGENGQILRTKLWIYDAIGSLLTTYSVEEITIGRICKKANVSRSVFYNHYRNKTELLLEIYDRITAVFEAKSTKLLKERGVLSRSEMIETYCHYVSVNRGFIVQLHKNGYGWIVKDAYQKTFDRYYALLHGRPPEISPMFRQYFIPAYACATTSIILSWLTAEEILPVERIAETLVRFTDLCQAQVAEDEAREQARGQ